MAKLTLRKRIFSALLTLCLTVIMLAGFIVSAPVEVKAATLRNFTIYKADIDANRVNIAYRGWFGVASTAISPGAIMLSDGTTTYTFSLKTGTGLPLSNTSGGLTLRFSATSNWDAVPVYDPAKTYTVTIKSGYFYDEQGDFPDITFTLPITPPYTPFPVSDYGSAAYYGRHYNYWLSVFAQLKDLPDNGSFAVDTNGQGIDHIQHFVFDALVGTNRTLTVKHNGETYVIRGTAESEGGKMGGILLGHNHSFATLSGYKT